MDRTKEVKVLVSEEQKAVQEAWERGEFERCLALALEWRQGMLQEPEPSAESLGLARYYELRSRWECKQAEEVCRRLEEDEGGVFLLSLEHLADLCEIGVKASAHLQRADKVVDWGQKCMVLHKLAQRPERVAGCALLVCYHLEHLGEDRKNADFVKELLDIGYDEGDDIHLFWGYVYMFGNVEQTQRVDWMRELILGLSVLVHLREIAEEESIDLESKIRGSSWFESVLKDMTEEEGLPKVRGTNELSKQSDPFCEGGGSIQWS